VRESTALTFGSEPSENEVPEPVGAVVKFGESGKGQRNSLIEGKEKRKKKRKERTQIREQFLSA